jgi:hypothetical protein
MNYMTFVKDSKGAENVYATLGLYGQLTLRFELNLNSGRLI